MNGGYLIVSKNDTNLYEKLNKALTLGKPVLWYEDENTCYYIDTITLSGTDIILTKGGKTITIENDGDITESGSVSAPTMENIKDLAGNLRFTEGTINFTDITDVTITFSKWSLSGTHLMLVIAGEANNGAVIPSAIIANCELPDYIVSKITPIVSDIVDRKEFTMYAYDYTSQSLQTTLLKSGDILQLYANTVTLSANRGFRLQFDLLIDNE